MAFTLENKELRGITLKSAWGFVIAIVVATVFVVGTYSSIKNSQDKTLETLEAIQANQEADKKENKMAISVLMNQINDIREENTKLKITDIRYEIILKENGLMPYSENP